jgi:hypothetical protein
MSASMRCSSAAVCRSSSRAISACANASYATSASGGPRHSASASRSSAAAFEAIQVELAVGDLQHVAVGPGDQPLSLAVVERAAQLADVVLEDLRCRRRRRLAPQRVNQPLAGNRLVAMQQQEGEDTALPPLSERERAVPVADLERSQQAIAHVQTS